LLTYQSEATHILSQHKQTPTKNGEKYNGYQRIDNAVHRTSGLRGALLAIEVGVTLWVQ
jgi:hypothetical protein